MNCDGYELCGCSSSDDGHCMMCCRPVEDHPREQIEKELAWLRRELPDHTGIKAVERALMAA